ncbi:MAG: MFS transporter [Janthinobacterium lividum]
MTTSAAAPESARSPGRFHPDHPHYRWVALSNTTLGMLLVTINSSIVIISLPAIFRGIGLDPLGEGNVSYLLWMLMGYLLATAVFVVTFGRLGDMFGRVKIYNLGFVVFTASSLALSFDPFHSGHGALWLIGWRVVQGVGGAMLFANSTAILTDAFPSHQRGFALGINQIAAILGSFLGLIIGGVLAEVDWRAIFWVSVPVGVLGTVWSIKSLHDTGVRRKGSLDWPGNITFAVGLTLLLTGITYGIQPYGSHLMGWTSPSVLAELIIGVALLVAFCFIEARSKDPMFHLQLFRVRAFGLGNLAGLLASIGRGGLQFMLIIWLQGVWLPQHGFSYEQTPLWAGIYLLPLSIGFLVTGPVSGWLSDRFGARPFAVGGLLLVAVSFGLLALLPMNFPYWAFALVIALNGLGSGIFSSPNTTAIMNSVPARQRGAASGMRGTFFNSGSALSIGIFFSLMIVGLSGSLAGALRSGLTGQHVPLAVADQVAGLSPVGSLFAAFLGFNPLQTLLQPSGVLATLPPANASTLTGTTFFPQLISGPLHAGLVLVFITGAVMMLVGAVASWFAGGRFVAGEDTAAEDAAGVVRDPQSQTTDADGVKDDVPEPVRT